MDICDKIAPGPIYYKAEMIYHVVGWIEKDIVVGDIEALMGRNQDRRKVTCNHEVLEGLEQGRLFYD